MIILEFQSVLCLGVIFLCFHSAICEDSKSESYSPEEREHMQEVLSKVKQGQLFIEHKIDLNDTISEVQRILSLDPNLPRLTRGEIVDLLENITKTDELFKLNKTRKDHERAVMLVMPFNPKNVSREDMQELYTKRPVVQMIGNNGNHFKESETKKVSVTEKPTEEFPENVSSTPKYQVYKRRRPIQRKDNSTHKVDPNNEYEGKQKLRHPVRYNNSKNDYSNNIQRKPIQTEIFLTTEKPIKIEEQIDITSKDSSFNKTEDIPDEYVFRKRPVIRRPSPFRGTGVTVKYPNHKYPEDELKIPSPTQAMKVVEAPKLALQESSENIEPWRKRPQKISSQYNRTVPHKVRRPVAQSTTESTLVAFHPYPIKSSPVGSVEAVDIDIPDHFKQLVKDIDLNTAESQKSSAQKYSSQYTASPSFPPKPAATPIRDNIKGVLASIGLFPNQKIPSTTTTTTSMPDISSAADALDPSMKELLMSFGLLPDPNKPKLNPQSQFRAEIAQPPKPVIDPGSYLKFKPLPDTAPSRQDMEEFLSRFGLVSNSRSLKTINVTKANNDNKPLSKSPQVDVDMFPEGMKDILEDIGITHVRQSKKIESNPVEKTKEKAHVFKPESVTASASDEELKKLELLLSTIKQLEKLNGNITQSDLDALDMTRIKELSDSLNKAPQKTLPLDEQEVDLDPLSLDELQELFKTKNDFKRQESNLTESVSSTTSTTTTTTEEPKNAPIADLAESFGGTTNTDPEPDATLPQPRRNGFYFLLDWNSFLDVEGDTQKVNLRFAPKIGDPQRFYSVKVP